MKELLAFLHEVADDLGREMKLRPPVEKPLDELPPPLAQLYSHCDGGDLLFGTLFTREQLLRSSQPSPISPSWVSFGSDGLGIQWLCAKESVDGNWFTTWDHEVEWEVDGPAFVDLREFLESTYERILERRSGSSNFLLIAEVPTSARARVVIGLKHLTGLTTLEVRKSLEQLPLTATIEDVPSARRLASSLRDLGVVCSLKLDFL